MVLRLCPDSREISFRVDDCPTRKVGRLLPTGVIKVYMIRRPESITTLSGYLHATWLSFCNRYAGPCELYRIKGPHPPLTREQTDSKI